MGKVGHVALSILAFAFRAQISPKGPHDGTIQMASMILFVVHLSLLQHHLGCDHHTLRTVVVMIEPLAFTELYLCDIGRSGIVPFLVAGRLGNDNVRFIEPGMGWIDQREQENKCRCDCFHGWAPWDLDVNFIQYIYSPLEDNERPRRSLPRLLGGSCLHFTSETMTTLSNH